MDEGFPRHVEQSDGQSDSFPHEQHQQQQDDLKQQRSFSLDQVQMIQPELRATRR